MLKSNLIMPNRELKNFLSYVSIKENKISRTYFLDIYEVTLNSMLNQNLEINEVYRKIKATLNLEEDSFKYECLICSINIIHEILTNPASLYYICVKGMPKYMVSGFLNTISFARIVKASGIAKKDIVVFNNHKLPINVSI